MSYVKAWNAIAARIKGLSSAAQLHATFLKVRDSDSYDRGGHLATQCRDTLLEIERFANRFRSVLPPNASSAIESFVSTRRSLFNEAADGPDTRDERSRAVLVLLTALETEISYLLDDIEPFILARSELAFAHLQRSIFADPSIEEKWKAAFSKGEVACEKLGAVHLLSHGIWAFKASSPKAITDLVFQDQPVTDAPTFAAGLVLTEWKVASAKGIAAAFATALSQAKLYAPGALSGNELTGYRYLVVVTDRNLAAAPADIVENKIIFRHVLLSVSPVNTSKRAAAQTKK